RGRKARRTVLLTGLVGAPREDDEIDLRDGYFVQFHQPYGQPVGELSLLNLRQLQRRRGAELRWMRAVGRLLCANRRDAKDEGGKKPENARHQIHQLTNSPTHQLCSRVSSPAPRSVPRADPAAGIARRPRGYRTPTRRGIDSDPR